MTEIHMSTGMLLPVESLMNDGGID